MKKLLPIFALILFTVASIFGANTVKADEVPIYDEYALMVYSYEVNGDPVDWASVELWTEGGKLVATGTTNLFSKLLLVWRHNGSDDYVVYLYKDGYTPCEIQEKYVWAKYPDFNELVFCGDSGLIPDNGIDMAYVQQVVNMWKYPDDYCPVCMLTVLEVINRWKYPLP